MIASLSYQITPKIYVKGTAYFALTPSVLMAGGSLEARAEVGSASAWFLASIDFFVSWEPYHYDLQLQIAIGAKWWIFETELSAKLTIWGPEFSGRAEISWTVFKFTVDFGASASRGPVPIRFAPFQSKFIPDVNKVVSVRVTEGIRGSVVDSSGGTSELPVVNPAGLVFELRSSVPAKTVIAQLEDSNALGDVPLAPSPRAEVFGIAPMNVNAVASSAIRFTIKRDGVALPRADFMAHFRAVPIEQGFPTGMWGRKLKLDPAEKSVVVALAGYTISAAPPAREPSPGKRRDADEFKFGNLPNPAFPPPSTAGPVQFQAAGDITLAGVLQGETAVPVAKFRSDLLKTLGIEPTDAVTIGASLPGSFLTKNSAPKMVKV